MAILIPPLDELNSASEVSRNLPACINFLVNLAGIAFGTVDLTGEGLSEEERRDLVIVANILNARDDLTVPRATIRRFIMEERMRAIPAFLKYAGVQKDSDPQKFSGVLRQGVEHTRADLHNATIN